MNAWIVVNIGCIECEVSSNIVGVFSDKNYADELARKLEKTHSWKMHLKYLKCQN